MMRWFFSSALVLAWTAVVSAKSFTGNRLLVVLEEQSEREKYSVFLEDLTCKSQFSWISDHIWIGDGYSKVLASWELQLEYGDCLELEAA